mmetsp:Transcript_31940/g.49901  ORF Transcript_31940/g.49901 Transcript_31940/m.49901 type:complete len:86 (+) Transcript_31940:1539-1796(+)
MSTFAMSVLIFQSHLWHTINGPETRNITPASTPAIKPANIAHARASVRDAGLPTTTGRVFNPAAESPWASSISMTISCQRIVRKT